MLIKRDSLVRLNCKRGKAMSPEYYRVLGFFSKYYNKWWVTEENQFSWTSGSSSNKNNRILGRLMKKVGSSYREVELKAGGDWAPHQVYRMVPFDEIVCIENELVDL